MQKLIRLSHHPTWVQGLLVVRRPVSYSTRVCVSYKWKEGVLARTASKGAEVGRGKQNEAGSMGACFEYIKRMNMHVRANPL